MPSTRQSPFAFSEDALVFDSSGSELGRVAEVRDGYFKVDVSMASDYWLPFDTIERMEGNDRVYLNLSEDQVDDRKLDSDFETLTDTEVEEALSPTDNPTPVERRYDNEADYLKHGRPLI